MSVFGPASAGSSAPSLRTDIFKTGLLGSVEVFFVCIRFFFLICYFVFSPELFSWICVSVENV